MTDFPVMRGNAAMARGASYFEVPLFSHVIDNLWQGCSPAEFLDWSNPMQWLETEEGPRFDKILNLWPWGSYFVPEGTEKIDVVAYDGSEVDYNTFQNAAILVMDWLEEGHKVLVHCQAGLNRSSFVVALVLMERYKMSADEAINHIRKSRSEMCLCNDEFRQYLKGLV
jgi:hypothetical protein